MTDAPNILRIDDKWSVKFDPENNDRPQAWLRHGEHQGPFIEHNGVTAMFYALLDRADLAPSADKVAELVEALRGMVKNAIVACEDDYTVQMTQQEWEDHCAATKRACAALAALAKLEAGE